jgi:hypothetical protein
MYLYFTFQRKVFVVISGLLLSANLLTAQDNPAALPEKPPEKTAPAAKFIPDISLNADFSGVYRDVKQPVYDALELPALSNSGDTLGTLNQKNGFNFNYAELTMYSAVDPYFDLFTAFHLTETTFEIEEAYVRSLSFPLNFQLKLGKFLSSFGRLNDHHPHSWDFSDQPLAYFAFFGAEHLKEKGAKLTWLAPTPFYLLLGAETLIGENAASFGVTGFSDPAKTHTVESGTFPGLYVGYVKSSFDVDDLVVLFGVSAARGDKRNDYGINNPDGYAVYGTSQILGGDLTLKWLIDSFRYLSWESEYLYRNVKGDAYFNSGATTGLVQNQSGFYSQLVFRFAQQWKVGVRYDLIQMNNVVVNSLKQDLPENLPRYTIMLEYSPSEFSRFRLQYSHDRSAYNGSNLVVNNQVSLDANFNIGSHGAHNF